MVRNGQLARSSALLLALSVTSSVFSADPVLITNISNLAPNLAGQQVQVLITGSDSIIAEDIGVQINNGTVGPLLTAIDALTLTPFAGNNNGQNGPGLIGTRGAAVTVSTATGTVPDNGRLVTLTIDTTGLTSGTFTLNLNNTTFNGTASTDFILANLSAKYPTYIHNQLSIGDNTRQWTFSTGGTWDTDAHWSPFAPYAAGDAANFLSAVATGTAIVTLDGPRVAGSITFNNTGASYNIAPGSGGTLQLNNGLSAPLINNLGGSHTISAPINFASAPSINVQNVSDLLTISSAVNTSQHITLTGAGKLVLGGGVTHSLWGVSGNGRLATAAGTNVFSDGIVLSGLQVDGNHTIRPNASNQGASQVTNLSIAGDAGGPWTGKLDLTDNALIIPNATPGDKATTISLMKARIASGKNGGTWTGNGITSSTVAANATNGTPTITLALADAGSLQPLSSYRGQFVDSNSVIVVQARFGDATLNGKVDSFDLTKMAAHWNNNSGTMLYSDGDFNGDGNVNSFDLTLLAANWQFGVPGSLQAALAEFPQFAPGAVPEPASVALLALGAGALVAKRRKRQV